MFKAILALLFVVAAVFIFLSVAGMFINKASRPPDGKPFARKLGSNIATALKFFFIGMLLLFGAAFANNVFGPWF